MMSKFSAFTVLIMTVTITLCAQAQQRPPNIILILTDDQGWGDVGIHGNRKLDTPAIDSLAVQGVSFSRFYVNPVCAPTRASLLTGRYSLRTGVHNVTRGQETIRSEEVTVAEVLKSAGYATGAFGKWHNGANYPHTANGQGFDEFFGFNAGHWSQYFNARLLSNDQPVATEGYITDVITDRAMAFMAKHRRNPFFLYLPYNAPHSPFQVPDTYFDKYQQRGFDDRTAAIYGMVENIDHNIGRLLHEIEQLKLVDNTIVVFLSDNGPHGQRYNGGMRDGKGSVHEGGVRVPFFVHWPGRIEGGRQLPQIAQHIDVLPTLLSLAGVDIPEQLELDGIDLSPWLENDVPEQDRKLFSHKFSMGGVFPQPGAVRTRRWVATLEQERWSLFDILADPSQTRDLARVYPNILASLARDYDQWFADVTRQGFSPLPTTVGAFAGRSVELPAHEAYLRYTQSGSIAGIAYAGGEGWSHSWITDWTDTGAYPEWNLAVAQAGNYEFEIEYALPESARGTELVLKVGERRLPVTLDSVHRRQSLPAPDRAPRYSVFDQTWARVRVGEINLHAGQFPLQLTVKHKPALEVMELKSIYVKRL